MCSLDFSSFRTTNSSQSLVLPIRFQCRCGVNVCLYYIQFVMRHWHLLAFRFQCFDTTLFDDPAHKVEFVFRNVCQLLCVDAECVFIISLSVNSHSGYMYFALMFKTSSRMCPNLCSESCTPRPCLNPARLCTSAPRPCVDAEYVFIISLCVNSHSGYMNLVLMFKTSSRVCPYLDSQSCTWACARANMISGCSHLLSWPYEECWRVFSQYVDNTWALCCACVCFALHISSNKVGF